MTTEPRETLDARCRAEAAVVIPCYNAGDRVRPVLDSALRLVNRVIIVDDGSTDGAIAPLAEAGAEIVTLPVNRGKGHALLAGFAAAVQDDNVRCVITLDADGQHDPAEIPTLYSEFLAGDADFVIGARTFSPGQIPFRSWFGNRLTAFVLGLLIGQGLPDTQSGFRLHSRRFAEHIVGHVGAGRYETEMEIVVRAVRDGFRVSSVPIQTIYERGNPSSHFHKLRDSWLIYRRLFRAVRAARRG